MGTTNSTNSNGTSDGSSTTVNAQITALNKTIQSLNNQLAEKNNIIKNYNLSAAQISSLTNLATAQTNAQELIALRAEKTANLKKISDLEQQVSNLSPSNEFVGIVLKLQKIERDMNLSLVELRDLSVKGLTHLDDQAVRLKILKVVKTRLLLLYNSTNLNIDTVVFPNEDTALIGSSLFFLYYIYQIIDQIYLVFNQFK